MFSSKIARDMACDINGRSRDFVWGFCAIESKLQVDMDAGVVKRHRGLAHHAHLSFENRSCSLQHLQFAMSTSSSCHTITLERMERLPTDTPLSPANLKNRHRCYIPNQCHKSIAEGLVLDSCYQHS